MKELEIHEVFPVLQKGDDIFSGVFDSRKFPYSPAPPVRCNYYSAMLITKGKGFLVSDNFEYVLKKGRLFIFNDRQVIGWSYYENVIGLIVAFTSHVALSLNIQFDKPYIDIDKKELPLYTNIFQNFIHQFNKKDHLSDPIVHSGIRYLYSLFSRQAQSPEIYDRVITSLRNEICSNYSKDLSVEEIASVLNVSGKVLNERCLKKIGLSVKQYILELKLTEAKRLLVFSEWNTSQIAFQIGMEDPSYFARIFRKKTGMSPSDFIKKYRR